MDPATDNNKAAKRAKVDSSVDNGDNKTPLAQAKHHVKQHIASLHPNIANILLTLGLAHLSLQAKLHIKLINIKRMEDDDEYIPRSAKIEFRFALSKKAEETPEFITLQKDTTTLVKTIRNQLKAKIIAAAKIEAKVIRDTLVRDFAKAVRLTTNLFLTTDRIASEHLDKTVNTLLEVHHGTVLKYITADLETFRTLYTEEAGIETLPNPIHFNTSATEQPAAASRHFTQPLSQPPPPAAAEDAPIQQLIPNIHRVIEAVFVASWSIYLDATKHKEITLCLKQLQLDLEQGGTTAKVAFNLDNEAAASMPQLQELVRKETAERTKSLEQQVKSLQQSIKHLTPAKKQPRGQTNSASKKKENDNTRSDRSKSPRSNNQRRQQRDRKAAAADSESTKKTNRQRSSGNSKKKSQEKNTSSSRGRSNRSRQSRSNSN